MKRFTRLHSSRGSALTETTLIASMMALCILCFCLMLQQSGMRFVDKLGGGTTGSIGHIDVQMPGMPKLEVSGPAKKGNANLNIDP